MASHIDKGTPPESVSKIKAVEAAILAGEDLEPRVVEEVSLVKEQPVNQPKPERNLQKVTLEHSLYTLSCGALDVSVSDHQIAIKLPKTNHFSFEPKVNSNYVLKFMGESYDVVYLGGVFNFPNDKTWAITFLMDTRGND